MCASHLKESNDCGEDHHKAHIFHLIIKPIVTEEKDVHILSML